MPNSRGIQWYICLCGKINECNVGECTNCGQSMHLSSQVPQDDARLHPYVVARDRRVDRVKNKCPWLFGK